MQRFSCGVVAAAAMALACSGAPPESGAAASSSNGGSSNPGGSRPSSGAATSSSGGAGGSSGAQGSSLVPGGTSGTSSSSGVVGCAATLRPVTTLPQSYAELGNLTVAPDGALVGSVHQTLGDTLYVLRRGAADATWTREDVAAPPGTNGFGVFNRSAVGEDGRVHLLFTAPSGAARDLWHATLTGTSWAHQRLSTQTSVLVTRVVHAGGTNITAWDDGAVRSARILANGTAQATETVSASGDGLRLLAAHPTGGTAIITTRGSGPTTTAHLWRRGAQGGWTSSPVNATAPSPRHAVVEADGTVQLAYQVAGDATFTGLRVARINTAGQVTRDDPVETAARLLVQEMDVVRRQDGTWQWAYVRVDLAAQPQQKDLVLVTESPPGTFTRTTIAANLTDVTGGTSPLAITPRGVVRLTNDGPVVSERVVCP